VDRRHRPEWRHKERAIRTTADTFRRTLRAEALGRLTFVPIPFSKTRADPLRDDRLTRMLGAIQPEPPLDIREFIPQTRSTEAAHGHDVRPRPSEIEALYRIDETLAEPAPRIVALVDDLLTTGAHFRAATSVLRAHFAGIAGIGLFVARRAPETAELDEFGDDMS